MVVVRVASANSRQCYLEGLLSMIPEGEEEREMEEASEREGEGRAGERKRGKDRVTHRCGSSKYMYTSKPLRLLY